MRAIRFHEYGDPDVLRYEEADRPAPEAGEVLVEVAGTSFNPVDTALRAGFVREIFPLKLPHTPGLDVSGTIAELGAGVTGHRVGDQVVALLPMTADGAAADFVRVPADAIAKAPQTIPRDDAAALPTAALTAWQAINEHAAVTNGQLVLVNGAGGAVGRYAVQFAKLAGATVIGTAGPHSIEAARTAGADRVIDYTVDGVDEPVDVVFTTAGVDGLTELLRPGGVLVSIAGQVPADPGPGIRALNMYVRSDAAQLTAIGRLIDEGRVTVRIAERHPIAGTAAVHRAAAAGDLHGKVVLYRNS